MTKLLFRAAFIVGAPAVVRALNSRDARRGVVPLPPSAPQRDAGRPVVLTAIGIAAITALLGLLCTAFLPLLWGWKPLVITSGSMSPAILAGDVVLIDTRQKEAPIGSTIAFRRSDGATVTHRVSGRNEDGTYKTKGDANVFTDSTPVAREQMKGVVRMAVPLVGRPATALRAGDLATLALIGLMCAASLILIAPTPGSRRSVRLAAPVILTTTAVIGAGLFATVATAAFTASTANAETFRAGSEYYNKIIADNPVAYYRFDETAGPTLADRMNLAPLTVVGSPTYAIAGAIVNDDSTAFDKPATSQYARSAASIAGLSFTGSVSVEIWFKPSVATQTSNARLVSKYNGTVLNYLMAYDSAGTKMRFLVEQTNGTRPTALTTVSITDTTKWYHLVGTWDGTNARIYVDGVVQTSATGTGPIKTITTALGVGAVNDGGIPVRGALDEVSIWNREVTSAEVTAHYDAGT